MGDPEAKAPRGRYAPSPTGELHLGNASTALLSWLSVRSRGGRYVMRLEDLDRPRVRAGAAERIFEDLAWLGLDWDEEPVAQSDRLVRYARALSRLERDGYVYPCFCSRRDIASAASAPQAPGDEVRYPGTCRRLSAEESRRRIAAGKSPALRFRVRAGAAPAFDDLVLGPQRSGDPPGDFVVQRSDGAPAYQLAVVVDDAAMGIDEVVRADDLLASTFRQLLLFDALGLAAPAFGHVPLLLGPDGARLSKRHRGTSIRETREAGFSPEAIVGRLAFATGIASRPDPVAVEELVSGFRLDRVRAAPEGIRIDVADWR